MDDTQCRGVSMLFHVLGFIITHVKHCTKTLNPSKHHIHPKPQQAPHPAVNSM